MVTANEIEYKDALLVMLHLDAIAHKPDSPAYPWSLFFLLMGKPCGVQLSTQGLFYPIVGDRRMLELTLVCGNLLVGSARIFLTLRT